MNEVSWIVWCVFGAVLGGCWGSFAHVVYARTPKMWKEWKETGKLTLWWSIPKSHCPTCKTQLSWYENVPIFAWCVLRGRCRHCKTEIPARYALWELAWTVFGALLGFWLNVWVVALFWVAILAFVVFEIGIRGILLIKK
jgi:prepilin signal peptidase PulO-like enzyme (type II secretory pathway)